jgi:phenylacetate-CoA ligase
LPGENPAEFGLQGGILGRVDDMVIVRGVNLYPAAVDAALRAFGRVREYQVEIDKRHTLPQIKIRFEPSDPARDLTNELATHLRAAFQIRIEVEPVAPGTLPVFEFKARRWQIVT